MWVFAVFADLITSLQPKMSFYRPLYQVPNQQRGRLELRELQGGPGRAWGHSRKRRLAQAVLLVGTSHLSKEPVLLPLILMMAHRASKSPLSFSPVGSRFSLPGVLWAMCRGTEPGPWGAPEKDLAAELPPPRCGGRPRALGWRQEREMWFQLGAFSSSLTVSPPGPQFPPFIEADEATAGVFSRQKRKRV